LFGFRGDGITKKNMKHTKETDKAAIRRIKTLGDRSLSPDDHDDLERVLTRITEGVEARHQDEQEDSE
jgi:hypothetical protein